MTSQLRNMLSALEHRPDSIRDREAMSMHSRNFTKTLERHETFNREGSVAFTKTWWQWFSDRLPARKPQV